MEISVERILLASPFVATFHRVTRSTAEDALIFRFTRLERRCSRERRERGRDVAVEEELTDDRRRDNASPLRKATVVPACIVSPCCSRFFDPHTVPLRKRYAARLRRSNTDPALSRFSFPRTLPVISV